MKIAIVSDTHDNIANIKKFLKYADENDIEMIIHCGDVTDTETLDFFSKEFKGKAYLCFGNVDSDFFQINDLSNLDNIELFKHFGEIEIDNIKIGFVHYPNEAEQMAESQKYDHVFYGHTHRPWQKKVNRTLLSNPGTLGGVFYRPSFAVLDTDLNKLELKILDIL